MHMYLPSVIKVSRLNKWANRMFRLNSFIKAIPHIYSPVSYRQIAHGWGFVSCFVGCVMGFFVLAQNKAN